MNRHLSTGLLEDEAGMETAQSVLIVGLAAVVLVVLWDLVPSIAQWAQAWLAAFR